MEMRQSHFYGCHVYTTYKIQYTHLYISPAVTKAIAVNVESCGCKKHLESFIRQLIISTELFTSLFAIFVVCSCMGMIEGYLAIYFTYSLSENMK